MWAQAFIYRYKRKYAYVCLHDVGLEICLCISIYARVCLCMCLCVTVYVCVHMCANACVCFRACLRACTLCVCILYAFTF